VPGVLGPKDPVPDPPNVLSVPVPAPALPLVAVLMFPVGNPPLLVLPGKPLPSTAGKLFVLVRGTAFSVCPPGPGIGDDTP
jgi:hypothetical protein